MSTSGYDEDLKKLIAKQRKAADTARGEMEEGEGAEIQLSTEKMQLKEIALKEIDIENMKKLIEKAENDKNIAYKGRLLPQLKSLNDSLSLLKRKLKDERGSPSQKTAKLGDVMGKMMGINKKEESVSESASIEVERNELKLARQELKEARQILQDLRLEYVRMSKEAGEEGEEEGFGPSPEELVAKSEQIKTAELEVTKKEQFIEQLSKPIPTKSGGISERAQALAKLRGTENKPDNINPNIIQESASVATEVKPDNPRVDSISSKSSENSSPSQSSVSSLSPMRDNTSEIIETIPEAPRMDSVVRSNSDVKEATRESSSRNANQDMNADSDVSDRISSLKASLSETGKEEVTQRARSRDEGATPSRRRGQAVTAPPPQMSQAIHGAKLILTKFIQNKSQTSLPKQLTIAQTIAQRSQQNVKDLNKDPNKKKGKKGLRGGA